MKGWIYRIYHQQKDTGENWYNDSCYVGQTQIQGGFEARFRQHVRQCDKRTEISKKQTGKMAKLYDAMWRYGTENFKVQQLEYIQNNDRGELQKQLNERERYWQKHFKSVERGWNKVNAPQPSVKNQSLTDGSLAALARHHNVAYTSLLNRCNKLNETPQQAITYLVRRREEPVLVYRYGRQEFDSYRKVSNSRYNKNNVNHKTIENRVRTLINNGAIIPIEDEDKTIVDLVDSIFDEVNESNYRIVLPEGVEIEGSITDIYKMLSQREECNKKWPAYSTVVSRLKKAEQGKTEWTAQQAFGLDYPPNLSHVKKLIEEEDYKFYPETPIFNKLPNCKPIILESTKEIFASQKDFCMAYKIPQDQFSSWLKKGWSVEKVLKHLDIKA